MIRYLHGVKISSTGISFIRYLIAYKNLLRAIENIGIAVVYGIRYYGTGRITHDNYVQFIRHDALGFEYIDQSKNFVPQVNITIDVEKCKI